MEKIVISGLLATGACSLKVPSESLLTFTLQAPPAQ
jgi:hypothetical protein